MNQEQIDLPGWQIRYKAKGGSTDVNALFFKDSGRICTRSIYAFFEGTKLTKASFDQHLQGVDYMINESPGVTHLGRFLTLGNDHYDIGITRLPNWDTHQIVKFFHSTNSPDTPFLSLRYRNTALGAVNAHFGSPSPGCDSSVFISNYADTCYIYPDYLPERKYLYSHGQEISTQNWEQFSRSSRTHKVSIDHKGPVNEKLSVEIKNSSKYIDLKLIRRITIKSKDPKVIQLAGTNIDFSVKLTKSILPIITSEPELTPALIGQRIKDLDDLFITSLINFKASS